MLLAVFLVTLFFVTYFFSMRSLTYSETGVLKTEVQTHFRKEISGFLLPNTFEKDSHIAYYSILTRLDPIFALEGVDVASFKESIAVLKKATYEFATLYDRKTATQIREALYPFKFLEELGELEVLRQEVIKNPDRNVVRAYHIKLLRTIDLYIEGVARLKKTISSLETNLPEKPPRRHFLDGYTEVGTIAKALLHTEENALHKKNRALERWKCVSGNISYCVPLREAFNNLSFLSPSHKKIPDKEESEELLASLTHKTLLVRAHLSILRDQYTTTEENPPYFIVLNESRCFSDTPVYYSVEKKAHTGTHPALLVNYINDLYYYDTSVNSPFLKEMYEAGITYVLQNPLNMYMCTSAAQDITRVTTLYDIGGKISRGIFSSRIDLPDSKTFNVRLKKLREIEEDVQETNFLHEETIQLYLLYAGELLRDLGEVSFSKLFGEENTFMIEHMLSLLGGQSSLVNELILKATLINSNVALVEMVTGTSIPPYDLFVSRSYPTLFYFLFNKTFSPKPIPFVADYTHVEPQSFNLVSYESFIKNRLSDKEILLIARKQKEFGELFTKKRWYNLPFRLYF